MTSLAISSSVSAPSQASSQENESLNEILTRDIEGKITHHERVATLWNIAAQVSRVAFAALMLFAVVLASIHMPFLLIGLLALVPVAYSIFARFVYKPIHSRSEENSRIALNETQVKENIDTFGTKFLGGREVNELNIRIHLRDIGINPDAIHRRSSLNSYEDLVPAIARFHFWKTVSENTKKEIGEEYKKANELQEDLDTRYTSLTDDEEAAQKAKIYAHRAKAYSLEETQRLPAKLRAAHCLNVINRPFDVRPLEDFGALRLMDYPIRQLGNTDGNHNPYFIFKDRANGKISRDFVKDTSIMKLGQKIYVAAPAQ